MNTLDEDLRDDCPERPDPTFMGLAEAGLLNARYAAERERYRALHPPRDVKKDGEK